MEEYICPISFVNGEVVENSDLNELFIAGFRDKICTDYTHSLMTDEIKKSFNDNPSDQQIEWMRDLKDVEGAAFASSIMQYLTSNITDLAYNTLIVFFQNTGVDNATIDTMINILVNKIDIRDKVQQVICQSELPVTRMYPKEALYPIMSIGFDSIYSMSISIIFEPAIEQFVSMLINEKSIEYMYDSMYRLVYDEEPKPTTYSNMYNLCMSVLREQFDRITMDYRLALMGICRNVTAMCDTNPVYGLNAGNLDYKTDTAEYERTGLFGDLKIEEATKLLGEINEHN